MSQLDKMIMSSGDPSFRAGGAEHHTFFCVCVGGGACLFVLLFLAIIRVAYQFANNVKKKVKILI
jgi:hypothetical protein